MTVLENVAVVDFKSLLTPGLLSAALNLWLINLSHILLISWP
jgi:hypothetical protein